MCCRLKFNVFLKPITVSISIEDKGPKKATNAEKLKILNNNHDINFKKRERERLDYFPLPL